MLNKLKNIPIKIHLLILSISFAIVISTLYASVKINNKEELYAVRLGLPFRFVEQNQSRYDPPFPYHATFGSILEEGLEINYYNLALSVIVIFLAIDGTYVMISKPKKKDADAKQ